jgi:hypothetical protein
MRRNPDLPPDVACDPVSRICVGMLAITSPGTNSRTNTKVTIQVRVMPAHNPPEKVRILKDGVTLVSVSEPFTYSWDTTSEPEGSHEIGAAADIGDQTITADPIAVWVDRKAPSIESRSPGPNATNVALSDQVSVVFSEELDPSSVSAAAIALSSGGTTLNTVATLEADRKTVSVRLVDRSVLTFPATITATVNAGVKDLAGNTVGTLPSWSWAAPLWVKMPAIEGRNVWLAIDANDAAVVASVADTPSAGRLSVARYSPGAVWDFGLGSPTDSAVGYASVAIDGAGAPVIGWSENHVRAARWNGSAWTRIGGDIDVEVAAPASTEMLAASAAIASSGGLFVSWRQTEGTSSAPGYVAAYSGTTWELQPAGSAAGRGFSVLRIDGTGRPVAIFNGDSSVRSLLVERFEGGSWTTLDTTTERNVLFTLAIDGQDRPVILTRDAPDSAVLYVRAWTASGWVDLAPALATGSTAALLEAQVALRPDGNPVVLWNQPATSGGSLLHVARYNGSAWDTSYGTLVGTGGSAIGPNTFALDSSGAPTVAWTEQPSTGRDTIHVWKSNY